MGGRGARDHLVAVGEVVVSVAGGGGGGASSQGTLKLFTVTEVPMMSMGVEMIKLDVGWHGLLVDPYSSSCEISSKTPPYGAAHSTQ